MTKHKIFISYFHDDDQKYKDELLVKNNNNNFFIDGSVDAYDIDESLSYKQIIIKIRDEYLKDTTVTLVLLGLNTHHRRYVDREIYSSLIDGKINKRSGLVIIILPEFFQKYQMNITQENAGKRIYDNVKNKYAEIIVFNDEMTNKIWNKIDDAFNKKTRQEPDNSAPLKQRNSN